MLAACAGGRGARPRDAHTCSAAAQLSPLKPFVAALRPNAPPPSHRPTCPPTIRPAPAPQKPLPFLRDCCRVEYALSAGGSQGSCKATQHKFGRGEVRFVLTAGDDKKKSYLALPAAAAELAPVLAHVGRAAFTPTRIRGLADLAADDRRAFYAVRCTACALALWLCVQLLSRWDGPGPSLCAARRLCLLLDRTPPCPSPPRRFSTCRQPRRRSLMTSIPPPSGTPLPSLLPQPPQRQRPATRGRRPARPALVDAPPSAHARRRALRTGQRRLKKRRRQAMQAARRRRRSVPAAFSAGCLCLHALPAPSIPPAYTAPRIPQHRHCRTTPLLPSALQPNGGGLTAYELQRLEQIRKNQEVRGVSSLACLLPACLPRCLPVCSSAHPAACCRLLILLPLADPPASPAPRCRGCKRSTSRRWRLSWRRPSPPPPPPSTRVGAGSLAPPCPLPTCVRM